MHTTWAIRGRTPIIRSSGSWKKLTLSGIIVTNARGEHSRLLLRILSGTMDGAAFLRFLKELKYHMNGRKLLLFTDGLPAHRAQTVTEYVHEERRWLRIERFPAYAPELNPIEYLWGAMKKKHLGNARAEGLGALAQMVRGARKKMNDADLLQGFLKASTLFS